MYASIDIGSNAARLLIASFQIKDESRPFKIVQYVRVPTRLGDHVFVNKHIPTYKEELLISVMEAFSLLMQAYKVEGYRACATSALREADNGKNIVENVRKVTGIKIDIIDGKEEAELIRKAQEFTIEEKDTVLLVDVGGGSTELSLMNKSKVVISQSFELGTVRILDNQDKDSEWDRLKKFCKSEIKKYDPDYIIGTGGNINKIFELLKIKPNNFATRAKIDAITERLTQFSFKERIEVLGLNPDRADVIIPAGEIFSLISEYAKVKKIKVSDMGLRDGMMLQLKDKYHKD